MPAPAAQHVASVGVTIDGRALDLKYEVLLQEVAVVDTVAMPSMAVVTFGDPSGDLADDPVFDLGKQLEVKFGDLAASSAKSIFKGLVVALEPEFGGLEDGATLTLRAYDRSYFLTRGTKTRSWQQVTPADIVRQIAGESGLSAGTIDAGGGTQEYMIQASESDWTLLQRLARAHNAEVVVEDRKLHFRKLTRQRTTDAELEWGVNLVSFSPRLSLTQRPDKVTVRGWDPKQKKEIVGETTTADVTYTPGYGDGRKLAGKASEAAGTSKLELTARPVTTDREASDLAASALSRLAETGFEATGVAFGDPKLRAGAKVKISKVGTRFAGEFVLSSTVHTYDGRGYRTRFTIAGANARTLTELYGGQDDQPINGFGTGLVIGVVTNIKDPDAAGRVRVKFPTLDPALESQWARVATLHAGADRGIVFMPAVNDEVVVGFENGDLRRPYVLGSVFNHRDKPGSELYKAQDDHLGSLLVDTPKQVRMTAGKEYSLKVGTETKVEGQGLISVESKGGNVTITAGGNLELKATGQVKINGQAVEVQGQSSAKFGSGGMTQVSGSQVQVG
jgi:uncharacterized protein involved in type VI secretion and phage assembly